MMKLDSAGPATAHELNGIPYLEYCAGSSAPPEDGPLVVVMHSMAIGPRDMLPLCASFPGPARFILPQGFYPFEGGYSWFQPSFYQDEPAAQGAVLRETADRLAGLLAGLAEIYGATPRPQVTGMSQGGDLSYALALYHPGSIAAALPFGSRWLAEFGPADGPPPDMPPLVVFHGDDDPIVPVASARETVEWFEQHGAAAQFRAYPGVGHDISAGMAADLHAVIAELHRAGRP
jgi:phospholipase/carboxylesterase